MFSGWGTMACTLCERHKDNSRNTLSVFLKTPLHIWTKGATFLFYLTVWFFCALNAQLYLQLSFQLCDWLTLCISVAPLCFIELLKQRNFAELQLRLVNKGFFPVGKKKKKKKTLFHSAFIHWGICSCKYFSLFNYCTL